MVGGMAKLEPKFTGYLMAVLRKSIASWHGHEGWIALATYIAILLLPFLITGAVSKQTPIDAEVEYIASIVAVGWLFLLFVVIGPFLLWKETTIRNNDLENRLDTREARRQALEALGSIWEKEIGRVNKIAASQTMTLRDAAKMEEAEQEIYHLIGVVSPGEVSINKVIGNYDRRDHEPKFYPENWSGDNTLIVFRHKLLQIKKFIDKHTPPVTEAR